MPTSHLWSLAVEEQFYLLWPLAALLMSPVSLRRTALACIAAAELCRLAFVLHGTDGQINYVLLPTRMDTLAAGAFLACAFRDPALGSCPTSETGTRSGRSRIVAGQRALPPYDRQPGTSRAVGRVSCSR